MNGWKVKQVRVCMDVTDHEVQASKKDTIVSTKVLLFYYK